MKRGNVIILGILSVWPLIYVIMAMLVIFLGIIFQTVIGLSGKIFPVLFIIHFTTAFEILALLGYYISWLFKTNLVAADKKALWAVVLFCANMIAIPVFWYFYFWKPLTTSPQTEAKNATPEGANH